MDKCPVFSIVIPVYSDSAYNQEKYIADTMDSILR